MMNVYHVLTLSVMFGMTNGNDLNFICDDIRFDPSNDTWVLCNMFGSISQLYKDSNWFSYDSPDPCNNGWNFITCTNQSNHLNESVLRITNIGNFSDVGNSTQSVNTTYWPQKLLSVEFWYPNFSCILMLDTLPNTIESITFHKVPAMVLNSTNMGNISHLDNLKIFRIRPIDTQHSVIDIKVINKLPRASLEFLQLVDFRFSTFPNLTKFNQLTRIDFFGGRFDDKSSLGKGARLPPNLNKFEAEGSDLSGDLKFSSIMANCPNLVYFDVWNTDFRSVNFFGLNNNTYVVPSLQTPCDNDAYSLYISMKENDINNNYYYDLNFISNYAKNTDIDVTAACGFHAWNPRLKTECTGTISCFSQCLCFILPDDWQPALNDFYTASMALILTTITVTSIAFSQSLTELIYLKLISLEMIFLTIFWFYSALMSYEAFHSDTTFTIFTYYLGSFMAFLLSIIYPFTLILPLSDDFSNFYFVEKTTLTKKVLIENKYMHFIEYKTGKHLLPYGPRYLIIAPFKDNPKYTIFIKSEHYISICNHKYHSFGLSRIILTSIVLILYFSCVIYVAYKIITQTVFDTDANVQIDETATIYIVITAVVIGMLIGITSKFARFHFLCFEVLLLVIIPFDLFSIENGTPINDSFEFLFRSNEYFGMVDELGIRNQGPTVQFWSTIVLTLYFWIMILFSMISTILYIKYNAKSKIKGTYIDQLSSTISGIISGLVDYLTDILLIVYWVLRGYYVYATIELFFIVFGQVASSYLVNEVRWFVINNNNNNHDQQWSKEKKRNVILQTVLFGAGFGRIYQSVKNWKNNELIKYEYKWSKLLELMLESMPSLVLSTYATLMEGNKFNASVIVSMIFSFMNITNGIIAILDQDQVNQTIVTTPDENVLSKVILATDAGNKKNKENKDDINIPQQLWITNDITNEITYFAEKKLPQKKKRSKKEKLIEHCNSMCRLLLKFDIKIKNFMIWLFLTSDIFLNILSILSIVIFINYLFVNDVGTLSVNLINISGNQVGNVIYATLINFVFVFVELCKEYFMFKSMIDDYDIDDIDGHYRYWQLLYKYYFVGLFSNSLYFLLTIGLKYLPKMIDNRLFIRNQHWRIIISIVFVVFQAWMNIIFYIYPNNGFHIIVFKGQFYEFYIVFFCVTVLHLLSVQYIKKYVL